MDFLDEPGAFWPFAILAGTFLALAGLELLIPRRERRQPVAQRWFANLGLFVIDTLAVRVLVPVLLVGMAALLQERGWGLLNALELPWWFAFGLTLLVLDLAIYLQHWATHRIPILWRMHRVHHTDRDFDVTTAARFHPFEIVLSMLYKLAVVAALGPPVLAVLVFEVLFNALTVFTHSNIRLPGKVDAVIRKLLVTPDMHRVHHSTVERETNSNYGTILSAWDRFFGTYRKDAEAGQDGVTFGLASYQDARPNGLGWSLILPFLSNKSRD